MRFPPRIKRLWDSVSKAAKTLVGGHRREKLPAMIGLSPSARGLTGRPESVALHAREIAREWEDVAEAYVQKRMRQLRISETRIGAPDYDRGGERRAFWPNDVDGGTNDHQGRLFVDSGVLNPALNAESIGPEAAKLWASSRLRDRIDAVIAHEHMESGGVAHNHVVERVAETDLPITENARKILRATALGVRRAR